MESFKTSVTITGCSFLEWCRWRVFVLLSMAAACKVNHNTVIALIVYLYIKILYLYYRTKTRISVKLMNTPWIAFNQWLKTKKSFDLHIMYTLSDLDLYRMKELYLKVICLLLYWNDKKSHELKIPVPHFIQVFYMYIEIYHHTKVHKLFQWRHFETCS
jgi:hypothetical protein